MIRIVQMTFKAKHIELFKETFNQYKDRIRNVEGCNHLELLQDINRPNIFFTYSFWDNETFLNQYRTSELFGDVWAKTKILFDDKPQAWSVDSLFQLP